MSDFRLVILSYNHPQLTAKAVSSALGFIESSKIILFHNGSQVAHVEYLLKMFPQIQHHSQKENRGFSGGANEALRYAYLQSEWAFFMTNDCELTQLGKPSATYFYAAPLIFGRNKIKIDSIGGLYNLKHAHLRHCKSAEEFKKEDAVAPYIPGSAFWLHKTLFEKLNGFDESFHTYWEDVDFSLRASHEGFRLGLDLTTQLTHKGGKTCHKDSFYTSYLFQRNRLKVSRKYSGNRINIYLYRDLFLQAARQLQKRKWNNLNQLWRAVRDYHQ